MVHTFFTALQSDHVPQMTNHLQIHVMLCEYKLKSINECGRPVRWSICCPKRALRVLATFRAIIDLSDFEEL